MTGKTKQVEEGDERDSDWTGRNGIDRIALSNASHGFDGTAVLEDVTLAVERGEILAIIGPSGTGKTTLLRLLACFDRPDRGSVRIGGTDVWSRSARERLEARRRIGVVFQEATLFDATVHRNVAYGLSVRRDWLERLRCWGARLYGRGGDSTVTETLEIVGLADAATRTSSSLSGGEAQRVAFARAIAFGPEFLLLDEPTSDLDPRNTAVIEDAVETARSRGLGVAIATHDMHQARRVADRVAVLIGGRLIEVGATERIFSEPNDARARKFIDGELVF